MHIVVCTKHTPDSEAKMSVDEAGNVSWGESPLIINPWDEYAVEEALLLREKYGGTVTVISMGPEEALEALKHAIAMGCDEAIRIWEESCADSDTLATSYVLARAIEKMGDVDLVLFGKSAIDAETWQTGPAVARRLGYPSLMYTIKIAELDPDGRTITVERLLEEGRQVVSAPLPAVVGTTKGINEPRYTSFIGIRKAARMEYPLWTLADIGAEADKVGAAGSAVRWPQIFMPPVREGEAEIIEGETVAETARILVEKLLAEKVI
ncbi:MAG: electron transfer flavoprotein subunit beta [Chloroflexi bacterium]|nr:MAG: electron transfer flavoprotein subunit beta [Chloroflexota bacterium]RLC87776.1 MAG: electron transfer flavoprotein subunit beta [Chloroflexota bacterium]HEY68460.1 electron transfer flavoprotein subunit beta/FixA family protein [Thermoflexia bacterium]